MINWTATLRQASFNGLPFWVATGDVEAGHRVATTHIPNGAHVLESFGPKARVFEIEAYTSGDFCQAQAAALLAAAESRHRGVLVLPDSGAALVRLTKARRKFDKDKLGFIAVTLEATAEPALGGALSIGALAQQIYALASAIATGAGAYAEAFRISGQPAPVVSAAVTSAAGSLGDLVALRSLVRLTPAQLAVVDPLLETAELSLSLLPVDPAGFGKALSLAAIAIGDQADPGLLLATVDSLGPPAAPAAATVSTGTAQTIAYNNGIAIALTASMRALAVGESMARRVWRDRSEATAGRLLAASVFEDALKRIGREGLDLARDLSAMRGVVAELVTRQATDLAPVITVTVPARLPSLWWSWRLYNSPARAAELADRARVPHPAFMPEKFEALAA